MMDSRKKSFDADSMRFGKAICGVGTQYSIQNVSFKTSYFGS
jgi:hypothetical protein